MYSDTDPAHWSFLKLTYFLFKKEKLLNISASVKDKSGHTSVYIKRINATSISLIMYMLLILSLALILHLPVCSADSSASPLAGLPSK